MAYFNKNWSLDHIIEEFQFMAYSLDAEEKTRHLVATVTDFLAGLNAMKAEKSAARAEQLRFTAMIHAADRALDIALSGLSGQARQLEREDPTMKLLGTLLPEGLNAVTKYSGRGVEAEVFISRNLLGTLSGMAAAASLTDPMAKVNAACDKADAALTQLRAADAQVERNRTSESDLVERAYTTYHSIHADLVKLLNNNKRLINTFFLT
ncbi:hypothetical protein KKD52_00685 [Myxococcota bacterium]|nr:hypothetical protein [Myxococcota bacterium]MBU1411341.1 hypothetical protein [Myxococcota bacterium]MBU1508846.1 hypothetical protein [Myxococcota bacterium]